MIAFVSDIHGNTEALGQVWADIEAHDRRTQIYCLGDVIGYGPQPRECLLDVMERCEVCLVGNHEHGALFYAADFNPKARLAIEWTKAQLNEGEREENFRLWNYISDMPETHRFRVPAGEILLAHGSPRDPVREYLLPPDGQDQKKMQGCFEKMGKAKFCFVGHSHVPGVYPESGGFLTPDELGGSYSPGEGRCIVNIGSVGQPRDGDTRSSYVLLDPETGKVTFRRVEYDFRSTMARIQASDLDDYLADRLARGR
jgi:predicted phosphodiesterase